MCSVQRIALTLPQCQKCGLDVPKDQPGPPVSQRLTIELRRRDELVEEENSLVASLEENEKALGRALAKVSIYHITYVGQLIVS